MQIGIVIGSKSDEELIFKCEEILDKFGITFKRYICSAHRSPQYLDEIIQEFEKQSVNVIIAAAGMAAHLPGVIAAKTLIPVIGIPVPAGALQGVDALYSIVQMPKGIPVASMAINGSINAALYAVQMLSISDSEMQAKLQDYRTDQEKKVRNLNN